MLSDAMRRKLILVHSTPDPKKQHGELDPISVQSFPTSTAERLPY